MNTKIKIPKVVKVTVIVITGLALIILGVHAYFFTGTYDSADKINAQISANPIDQNQIQQIVQKSEKSLEQMNYRFIIDNKVYTKQDLRQWQKSEFIATNKLLNHLFKQDVKVDSSMPFMEIKTLVVAQEVAIGQENLKKALIRQCEFGELVGKVACATSFGRRKVSTADIFLSGEKYGAKDVMRQFEQMMTINNDGNQLMNFKANPNHFYSHGTNTTQEVVEMTGGTRFANRFYLKYGDTSGLITKTDPAFIIETVGTGYSPDGTVIGGVRHEMTDEGSTLHVRLQVEFPGSMPDYMIKQHEIHLLVEFSSWLTDIEGSVK